MPPFRVQEKPRSGSSLADVLLTPTTWPRAFTSRAPLCGPPRVPRSTMPPAWVHMNAWVAESPAMLLEPTTWPLGLTLAAVLMKPPSVPRSIPVTVGPAARASPVEAPPAPRRRAATTTAPKVRIDFNSLSLCLGVPERRVEVRMVCRRAPADDVAACIDGDGDAVGAADGA